MYWIKVHMKLHILCFLQANQHPINLAFKFQISTQPQSTLVHIDTISFIHIIYKQLFMIFHYFFFFYIFFVFFCIFCIFYYYLQYNRINSNNNVLDKSTPEAIPNIFSTVCYPINLTFKLQILTQRQSTSLHIDIMVSCSQN